MADKIVIIRIDWPVFPRCSHWMQWLKAVCRSTLWCQLLRPNSWEKWGAKCANHSTIPIQTRASCRHSTASPEEDQVQPRSQGFFPSLGTRLDQVTTSGSLHLRKSGFRSPGNLCRRNWESWALESGIQLKESGIRLTIGVQNQSHLAKNSETTFWNPSRIQDCLGFPYMGWSRVLVSKLLIPLSL